MNRTHFFWPAVATFLLVMSTSVHGQNLQNFEPAPGATGLLTIEGSAATQRDAFRPTVTVSHGARPLVARRADAAIEQVLIDGQTGLDLSLAWGAWKKLEASFALAMGYITGEGMSDFGGEGFTLGDLRLGAKYTLLGGKRGDRYGLATSLGLTAPTGDGGRFYGAGSVTMSPRLIGEFDGGALRVLANLGGRFRPSPDRVSNIQLGQDLTYAIGVELKTDWAALTMVSEAFGSVPVGDTDDPAANTPMEANLGLRYRTHGGSLFTVAGGFGVNPDRGVPATRMIFMASFPTARQKTGAVSKKKPVPAPAPEPEPAPEPKPEPAPEPKPEPAPEPEPAAEPSKAPETPEEAPEAPEAPADSETPVKEDSEPSEPAPEAAAVPTPEVQSTPEWKQAPFQDRVAAPIRFKKNAKTLSKKTREGLKEIAAAIVAHPQWGVIRVEGHSSAGGSAKANVMLSSRRAKAVRGYLVGQGVPAERLLHAGYGSSQPWVPHDEKGASGKNRRVEFRMVPKDASGRAAPFSVEEVKASNDGPLVFTLITSRSISPTDIEVRPDGSSVLMLRMAGAQVVRTWLELDDPLIKRSLLHPSTQMPPTGVVRVRMKKPMADTTAAGIQIQVDGKSVRISVPRW